MKERHRLNHADKSAVEMYSISLCRHVEFQNIRTLYIKFTYTARIIGEVIKVEFRLCNTNKGYGAASE
jgi:hypothetical protein